MKRIQGTRNRNSAMGRGAAAAEIAAAWSVGEKQGATGAMWSTEENQEAAGGSERASSA